MLFLIFAGNAKAAQRAEAGVDAVNRAWLRGEGFDEFAAAADKRSGFIRERAGKVQTGDLPEFFDGELMTVERNHSAKMERRSTTNCLNKQARHASFRASSKVRRHHRRKLAVTWLKNPSSSSEPDWPDWPPVAMEG